MDTILSKYKTTAANDVKVWFKAGTTTDFYENGGGCIKYNDKQIAIFNFKRKNAWYACQNVCPHKLEMVLSRGMLGDVDGTPKIACPMHKKTFSLETGENLNGNLDAIATYPVKIKEGFVFVGFKE